MKPKPEISHPGADMLFLRREAVQVEAGERSALAQSTSEWVVLVSGNDSLLGVDQGRNVAVGEVFIGRSRVVLPVSKS